MNLQPYLRVSIRRFSSDEGYLQVMFQASANDTDYCAWVYPDDISGEHLRLESCWPIHGTTDMVVEFRSWKAFGEYAVHSAQVPLEFVDYLKKEG